MNMNAKLSRNSPLPQHPRAFPGLFSLFLPVLISGTGWIIALCLDLLAPSLWPSDWFRALTYGLLYLPVGLPVLRSALDQVSKGNFFTEFMLMGLATLGAFAIREYPEAVAVMLFYTVGENFQSLAVRRAKTNISELMDQRPDQVMRIDKDGLSKVAAQAVQPGDRLRAQPGERLALDGILLSERGRFDTQSLTGEARPRTGSKGDRVLAGMINLRHPVEIEVTAAYEDSRLSQILDITQKASAQKAPTERFIRRFARHYTPVVVGLALALCLLPYFWADPYVFRDWLYRALVFLVISCPCALVISIPLGYVGGLGAASRQGILFKGSPFLDRLSRIRHMVWDKTGTLTQGDLEVEEIVLNPGEDPDRFLPPVKALEKNSQHPVAAALVRHLYAYADPALSPENPTEWEGMGIEAQWEGQKLRAGNFRWLEQLSIPFPEEHRHFPATTVALAYGDRYLGYVILGDRLRSGAREVIAELQREGVESSILSGDQENAVRQVAEKLNIRSFRGGLLPDEKVLAMEEIKSREGLSAFVGDGINDGPVLAWSDLGIAVGKEANLAMEAADMVIDGDPLRKIPLAFRISRRTRSIIWQNLILALVVKAGVLILGAYGMASLWEAVIADVGVTLMAIANAWRIQRVNKPGNRPLPDLRKREPDLS